MEIKHTPGPWTVAASAGNHALFGIKEAHDSIKAKYESGQPWQEEQAADSLLIAAAPDLLNVAQWARDAMRQAFDEMLQTIPEGGVVPPWMALLETTIVDAEHAIAKATGDQA